MSKILGGLIEVKGSQVTNLRKAIERAKKSLIKKAKQKGLWENFGQDVVRRLKDKYINIGSYTDEMNQMRHMIQDFNEWCMSFDLSKL